MFFDRIYTSSPFYFRNGYLCAQLKLRNNEYICEDKCIYKIKLK